MDVKKKNLIILHLTVFVWGFTGILGKEISIAAVPMVWYRVLIASVTLYVWFLITKKNLRISRKQFLYFMGTGAIVAVHWILFFHAIKVSTVSVAVVCLSAFTLFTAILEPIIKKQTLFRTDILVGLIIIAGILMIFKFETRYAIGIAFGLAAAVASSLFATINSVLVQKSEPSIIGFYELLGALFWVSLYRIFDGSFAEIHFNLSGSDWFYLVILGTICTSVAYVAGVAVMRTMSAFRTALITNLEPVYGVLLAVIFYGHEEKMTIGFYLGSVVILAAVFLYPLYKNKKNQL